MISDEGQMRSACEMSNAADTMMRAANLFSESVQQLNVLLGHGYGSNLELLIQELQELNKSRNDSAQEGRGA